jgi:hypothetical protein
VSGTRNNEPADPAAIASRMASIRGELRSDAGRLAQSTRRFFDWTAHVREHPWTSFGVVAALAYFLVPKRVEINSPSAEQLEKLAADNKLVIESNPTPEAKSTFLAGLTALIGHTVLRGALGLAAHKLGGLFQPPEGREQPPPRAEGPAGRRPGGSRESNSGVRREPSSSKSPPTPR